LGKVICGRRWPFKGFLYLISVKVFGSHVCSSGLNSPAVFLLREKALNSPAVVLLREKALNSPAVFLLSEEQVFVCCLQCFDLFHRDPGAFPAVTDTSNIHGHTVNSLSLSLSLSLSRSLYY
jgi:hypothetical protein